MAGGGWVLAALRHDRWLFIGGLALIQLAAVIYTVAGGGMDMPDGRVIGESAAIVLTLGERLPETGMVPMPNGDERPAFLRWLIYMAASPHMTFFQFNHPERFLDDHATHAALIENARNRLHHQFSLLDAAIAGTPFFLKSGLSALDFYAFMLVSFLPERETLLAGRPGLERLERVAVIAIQDSPET